MTERQHLEIYVTSHCSNCQYSQSVAERIRVRYPHVIVEIIDVETMPEAIPDTVFATPTYVLNGSVWSLGNPSELLIRETFSSG